MENTAITNQQGITHDSLQPISRDLLLQKYAHGGEATREEILDRVACGLAKNEADPEWQGRFRSALEHIVLGGRITASAGLENIGTTWVNCFVQPIADSVFESHDGVPGIMEAARQAAQTMRLGGGVGYDFSVIRPKGAWIKRTQSMASGPISYMEIFNAMCTTVVSAGARRGAQIAVLRCDHPDIEDFIVCKKVNDLSIPWDKRPLRGFNISVGITDALMKAVDANEQFDLVHIAEPSPTQKAAGAHRRADGKWVYKSVRARDLYDSIMQANYDRGEPGVLFLDRINADNNLRYVETITATNPCGEEPLPPYGCCDLGHILLPSLVTTSAWDGTPSFDFEKLASLVPVLVRMLDNVLDQTPWPLPEQALESANKRRVGIGSLGLGDTLIRMGLKYDSQEGRDFAAKVQQIICNEAYSGSADLAKERGAFPLFDADQYLQAGNIDREGTFASRLPDWLQGKILSQGVRNSHLLCLAPTGTGALTFGNNCSSGCEPVFALREKRNVIQPDGTRKLEEGLVNPSFDSYRKAGGDVDNLPEYFQTAQDLSVSAHVEMLKVLAPYVDAAISKTVNIPVNYPFEDFKRVYMQAWSNGLKGLTTFRPNDELGAVIVADNDMSNSNKGEATGLNTKAQAAVLDQADPDRRLRLEKLPETVMNSLRWLDRPHMPDGNPSYTYMVENSQGDFAVMVGHHVANGITHPFEVWINGAEAPRGMNALAKTLSADMRTFDKPWLRLKLESLRKCDGEPVEIAIPPSGELKRVPSVVSAFSQLVEYHADKIGWFNTAGDTSLTTAMMFRKEPKAGAVGTLSWTVDVNNPATGDDFVMFVKELEMPDGTRRPYSVWMAGSYPRVFDGLCKLLSIDMRIIDPAWIGMKLRKLRNYKEPQGDFWATVPGKDRQACYPSTIAYMAQLLLHRYESLGILDADGNVTGNNTTSFVEESKPATPTVLPMQDLKIRGTKCPSCSSFSLVKYNGCEKCGECGYLGSCG